MIERSDSEAWKAYDEAMIAASKAYDEAVDAAEKAYLAVVKAEAAKAREGELGQKEVDNDH